MMNLNRHRTLHLWSEKRLWRLWHHSLLRDNATLFLDATPLLEAQSQLDRRQDVKPEIAALQCEKPTRGELIATDSSLLPLRTPRTRFERLPNVSAVSAETALGDIRSLIREIVREELGRILPEMKYYTNDEPESPPDIATMVREEVMETLAPLAAPRQRNSIPRRNTTSRSSVSVRSPPRRESRNSAVPMRKTDMWRTDSNVPLCYHCGR
ncbi:hypothetical protein AVEN_262579-1, partial [Araneus ventricosus]